MDNVKKNDFFATIMLNPDLSLADLKANDIIPDNTALLEREKYKNLKQVKENELFQTDGKFDEKKFNKFYDGLEEQYALYASDEYLTNTINQLSRSKDAWWAEPNSRKRDTSPKIILNKQPFEQGISYLTAIEPIISPDLSAREIGQTQKVVDGTTGETLDYTPNDYAGLFSRFKLPTLVLDTYEEDVLDSEGELVHKKGEYKLNNKGLYQYRTLKDGEDLYGKEYLRSSDILTVDGSKWNKLDFIDSDGTDKGIGKLVANLALKVAPMFIPVVGEVYGYVGLADALIRVLPTFAKGIDSVVTGTDENQLGKVLTKWENAVSRFDTTQSDNARDRILSWEGAASMIGDVSKQLFQQKAIATIPGIINKLAKTGKSSKEIADISKALSYAFMSTTSNQNIYGDFKQAGASDRMAGLGMVGSTIALYKLMDIEYFRNNLFKDTFMDESDVREALAGASKGLSEKFVASGIIDGAENISKKEAFTLAQRFSNWYTNSLLSSISKKGVSGIVARSTSEAVEEVMEEVLSDAGKAFTLGLETLGVNTTEEGKKLDFNFTPKDFAQRYLTSFIGGFLGGSVFALNNSYNKFLNNLKYPDLKDIEADDMQKLVYYAASGKMNEITNYLENWHNKGILGSKNLYIDGDYRKTIDGSEKYIPASTGKLSQNDAVYETLKNFLEEVNNVVTSELPSQNFYTEAGMSQLLTLGYNEEDLTDKPNLVAASTIAALKDYASFENDLLRNLTKLGEKKLELKELVSKLETESRKAPTEDERKAQSEAIKNNEQVKALQEEIKELRKEKDAFFSGDKNKYYSGQMLFAADQNKQLPFVDISKESYTKLLKGVNYNSLSEEDKAVIDKEYSSFLNDGQNSPDYGIPRTGREKVYRAYDLWLDLQKRFVNPLNGVNDVVKSQTENNFRLIGISAKESIAKRAEKINKRIVELQTNGFAEDSSEMQEVLKEKDNILAINNILNLNPQLSLLSLDEKDKVFKELFDSSTPTLSLIDDTAKALKAINESTSVSTETTEFLLNSLKEEYEKNVKNGQYRLDDLELLTILKGISSSYFQTGGAESRVKLYSSIIGTKFIYEQNEESESLPEAYQNLFGEDDSWADGDSLIYSNIIREADNIVKNLGIDNSIVAKSVQAIKDILTAKTKLYEPGNEEQLKEFWNSILPSINGRSILDIISEFDALKQQIKYSPILDLFSKIGVDANNMNLLQLLEEETKNLINSPSLSDYIIRNESLSKSIEEDSLANTLGIIKSVLDGASDGTTETINNFKGSDEHFPKLAVISPEAHELITSHIDKILEKLDFLKKLSQINGKKALQIHKLTSLNMRPKWCKAIVGINEAFKKQFGIDTKELWEKVTGNQTFDPTLDSFNSWEENAIAFEDALYKELSKISDKVNLGKKIVNLFDPKTLYKSGNTVLSSEKDSEVSSQDLCYYIATIASVSPIKNQMAYIDAISSMQEDNLAPVYGQEFSVKQCIAQIINPVTFNTILDEIQLNADYSGLSDSDIRYEKGRSKLHNMITILGSAGCGKTIGVVKAALRVLQDNSGEVPLFASFLAKEKVQAEKVANSAGYDNHIFTVDEFFNKVLGTKEGLRDYKLLNQNNNKGEEDKNTGHWISETPLTPSDSRIEIFGNNGLRVLVIDEIETLTEAELNTICVDAELNGYFVIGLGDLKQPSSTIKGFDLKGSETQGRSGIDDCAFIRTPVLTTSMRVQTIAKSENTLLLSTALEVANMKASQNPDKNDIKSFDSYITTFLTEKGSTLYYYWDDENQDLAGDMSTTSTDEIIEKIKIFSEKQILVKDKPTLAQVAIITDNIEKYKQYQSDNIKVIDYKDRAGGEWDYVIVDVDLKKQNTIDGDTHPYYMVQDFYTLTQRSRIGTLIKVDKDFNTFKFKSDEQKAGSIRIDEGQIRDFKEWRLESLKNLSLDTTLEEEVVNSVLVTKSINDDIRVKGEAEKEDPKKVDPSESAEKASQEVRGENQNTFIPTATETVEVKSKETISPVKEAEDILKKPLLSSAAFLYNIADLFPSASRAIRKIISTNYTTLPTLEELWNSSLINEVRQEINNSYGNNGTSLFDQLINFKKQGNSIPTELLSQINSLRTIQVNLKKHGIQRNFDFEGNPIQYSGDFKGKQSDIQTILNSKEFWSWANSLPEEEVSFKSIKTIKNSSKLDNTQLVNLMRLIGDSIKIGTYNSLELSSILGKIGGTPMQIILGKFIGSQTKLYILPSRNPKIKLLVSRHIAQDGDMFDIPLLSISGTNIPTGEFTGLIELFKKLEVERRPGQYRTLNQIANNDNVFINKKVGVVYVTELEKDTTFTDVDSRSNKFLHDENGTAYSAITDLASVAEIFDSSNYGIYQNDGFGYSIKAHDYLELTGVQCKVNIADFLNLLEIYRKDNGNQLIEQLEFWKAGTYSKIKFENINDNDAVSAKALEDSSFLRDSKGLLRQLLPRTRAGNLLFYGAITAPSVNRQLYGFLCPPTSTEEDIHLIKVDRYNSEGKVLRDNPIYIGYYNGSICTGSINADNHFIPDGVASVKISSLENPIDFKSLFSSIYSDQNIIPNIHLEVKYKNKENQWKNKFLPCNWELSSMFAKIDSKEIDILESFLLSTYGIDGIIMNDSAAKDNAAVNTHWRLVESGKREYVSDHYVVAPTEFVINITPDNIIPFNSTLGEEGATQKQSLYDFVSSNNLKVSSESIEEANLELESQSKDWKHQYINETETGFELKVHDDSNFKNWFNNRFWQTEINLNENVSETEIDEIFRGFNSAKPLSTVKFKDIYLTIGRNVEGYYSILPITQEDILLEFLLDENLPSEIQSYIASRIFKTSGWGENILDWLKNNLEFAEIITKFEEKLDNC